MTPRRPLAPWQVWWVDLGNPIGHEQGGRRPGIVVSSRTHLRFPIDMALVVPLSTRDRGLDHHVPIASSGSGLGRPSWARTEDLRAVSTARFTGDGPVGQVDPAEVVQLTTWLREMCAFR